MIRRTAAAALALGAALSIARAAPSRAAEPLDLDRWDEFIQTAERVSVNRVPPRDSSADVHAAVRWLVLPPESLAAGAVRSRWVGRFRRALDASVETPGACFCTEQCWGCAGAEAAVPVVTFGRGAQRLAIAFLGQERCAVFVLDDVVQGCARLDLGTRAWHDLLSLPGTPAVADTSAVADMDELPRCVVRVPPTYPLDAMTMGVAGTVLVRTLVGPDGGVRAANALEGPGLLRDAAVACVRRWRYEPARAAGRPVAVWIVVPVRFRP